MAKKLDVKGNKITVISKHGQDYISLTDMLKAKDGAEYWSARDLQPMLGYSQWLRFEDAVKHAMASCETSGNKPKHHFAGAGKMIEVGNDGQREIKIQTRRDNLIDELETQLSQQATVQPLFACEWVVG